MRRPLDLDLLDLNKFYINIIADYGCGKTFLGGDMLKYEQQYGPVRFWNAAGEDGYKPLSRFFSRDELSAISETLETAKDVNEAIDELTKTPVHALFLDGLKTVAEFSMVSTLGEDRQPTLRKNDVGSGNEWTEVHWDATKLYRRIRNCADIVMVSCVADRNPSIALTTNDAELKKLWISPDLPGRQAREVGHWDFVGYLDAVPLSPTTFRRTITFTPRVGLRVRYRLPTPPPSEIVLPEGPGGWKVIRDTFERCMQVKETQAKEKKP